uniref:Condensin complex subunit 2 n=1 Tax=Macrostomum lignano TaxID=282301 RepID=A0A1I8I4J9_9PLAT
LNCFQSQPLLAADESGSAFADEAKLLNDDALERLARRRSQAAPSDPLQRMTARELSDHYENCIKLSVEGKISSKNAFALHLIDYLQGTVKGIDNFQLASSSLDAGAKIYAGRVDAVHREAYKVMGGLGRNDANPAAADSDGDEEAGGGRWKCE